MTMCVIGIDGRWLTRGPISGKVVLENQLKYLFEENVFIYLFVDKRFDEIKIIRFKKKYKIVRVDSNFNLFLRNNLILPFYVRKYKLDLLFCNSIVPIWPFRLKKVCFVHDILYEDYPEFFTLKERIYFKTRKISHFFSDHLITISETEKRRLLKHKQNKGNNISVIYNGVADEYLNSQIPNDDEVAILKAKYDLPDKFVFSLGRLNVRKNLERLIRAMPLVNNELHLVIGGSNDGKSSELTSLIESTDLKERIHFLGKVDQNDLPKLYSMAFIFCFPSLAEGFGIPPLEAMACSTPCCISNVTALPEVCGDAALYFDPTSIDQIAESINKISWNESIRENLIKKGEERANSFNWQKSSSELFNKLKDIMNG